MKESMKLIKVTNRCQLLTSRGACMGPILYPFYEKVSYILPMLGKGAAIVEVLDNGVEVPITIYNFDKDNSAREAVTHTLQQPKSTVTSENTPDVTLGKGQNVIMEKTMPVNNQNKNQNNFKQNKFNNNKNKNQQNNNQQQKNHVKLDTHSVSKEQKTITEDSVEEV